MDRTPEDGPRSTVIAAADRRRGPNVVGRVLTSYFKARAALARSVGGNSIPPDPRAEQLRTDGIVMLPEAIVGESLERIRIVNDAIFDLSQPVELIHAAAGGAVLVRGDAVDRESLRTSPFLNIRNYHRKIDLTGAFGGILDRLVSAYYRSRWEIRNVLCYRTRPVAEARGSYQWHTDNFPFGSLKVILYMNDVRTIADGPLLYALASQNEIRRRLGEPAPRPSEEYVQSRFRILECTAPAGTVIVFQNNGIHRAVPPREGHREVVNFTLYPALRPRPQNGMDVGVHVPLLERYSR